MERHMTDWRYPFAETGLNYISAKARQINDLAALLGVPPPAVAGANANYIAANGFAITPRTMYVAHVIGPQRAVDLFRTGSTGSPDIPSPDAAMGDQVRAWARALRGVAPMRRSALCSPRRKISPG
jgi:hypothetical protein